MKPFDRHAPWALGALMLIWTAGTLHAQQASDPLPAPVEEAVAWVNGEAISQADLDREVTLETRKLTQNGEEVPEEARLQLETEALDTLINRVLLHQDSTRQGFTVEPAEVDQELARFRGQFPDEQAFLDILAQFKQTPESFRRDIERGMTVQKMIDSEIAPGVRVGEDDIQAFYEENPQYFVQPEQIHVRHILIEIAEDAGDPERQAAMRKIQALQAKLAGGDDFSELARRYSQDPSAEQGGDIGFISRGQTVDLFDAAAFSLRPGQISGVVTTEFGLHLIQMVERQPASPLPIGEVRDTIQEYLKQSRLNEAVQRRLDELRSVASIEHAPADVIPGESIAPARQTTVLEAVYR